MMKTMAGQFGFGGGSRSATRKQAKGRKGKKGAARRPTAPRTGALPGGTRGMPDLSQLPPSLRELPPGLDQLPPGFDPSRLRFPKGK